MPTPTVEEDEARQPWVQRYLVGDMRWLSAWAGQRPLPVKVINWTLRAVGAPVFINNPVAGALMLLAVFINDWFVGLMGSLGALVAVLTAHALRQDGLESGGSTFHGMLCGLVAAATMDKSGGGAEPLVIIPVIILAVTSVYVNSGLGRIFSAWNLPAFNLPFCVTIFLYLTSTGVGNYHFPQKIAINHTAMHRTDLDTLQWDKVFQGVPFAMGQIYVSPTWPSSVLLLVALFLGSPTVCVTGLLGALTGALTAVAVAASPEQIYSGAWGYCALLSCASVAGFFCVPSVHSLLLALVSAFLATLIYGSMATAFAYMNLPVIAFPFVISASICLSFSTNSKSFARMPMSEITYPEQHWRRFGSGVRAEPKEATVIVNAAPHVPAGAHPEKVVPSNSATTQGNDTSNGGGAVPAGAQPDQVQVIST